MDLDSARANPYSETIILHTMSGTQVEKISDTIREVGLVVFASAVLPSILGTGEPFTATIGIAVSLFLWATGVWLLAVTS